MALCSCATACWGRAASAVPAPATGDAAAGQPAGGSRGAQRPPRQRRRATPAVVDLCTDHLRGCTLPLFSRLLEQRPVLPVGGMSRRPRCTGSPLLSVRVGAKFQGQGLLLCATACRLALVLPTCLSRLPARSIARASSCRLCRVALPELFVLPFYAALTPRSFRPLLRLLPLQAHTHHSIP